MLNSAISSRSREVYELECHVIQKIPQEFQDYDFLFNKEIEIHNRSKSENYSIFLKNESLLKELKEMIEIYKGIANIDLQKTKEGYLKIIFFKNIKNTKLQDGAHLIVEIQEGNFKIISIFPQIKISHFEDELHNSHNFTYFITKLANEFLKFI